MSWIISPDLIADAQAAATAALTDTCTNSRTGAAIPCRVTAKLSEVRPPGNPVLIRQQSWQVFVPVSADVQPGDLLTVTGRGSFAVVELASAQTYAAVTGLVAAKVTPLTASTTRNGTTHLSALTCYGFPEGFLLPLQARTAIDRFGEESYQVRELFCGWPTGSTEDWPVAPSDQVTLPPSTYSAGGTYNVRGVDVYPGAYLLLYVDVLPPG